MRKIKHLNKKLKVGGGGHIIQEVNILQILSSPH